MKNLVSPLGTLREFLKEHPHIHFVESPYGGEDMEVHGVCSVEKPQEYHLLFIKNKKILKKWGQLIHEKIEGDPHFSKNLLSKIVVILDKSLLEEYKKEGPLPSSHLAEEITIRDLHHAGFVCVCDEVMLSLTQATQWVYEKMMKSVIYDLDGRIHSTATIHPSARIGQKVFIGDRVVVEAGVCIHPGSVIHGPSTIGEGSTIFPNVTIYPFTSVGKSCRIHSGAVIGADGFGYVFNKGTHHKLWHLGGVILEDQVEIGALSAVDAGTLHPTRVGFGSKIDNHVQVGHNCQLGKGVILCGHVAIGGSSWIGDYCVFGGKSGMGPDIHLGPGCQVAGGALVNCDWPAQTALGGHPARPLREWMKGLAYLRKKSLHSSQ
jgi:UDP-3-O-[3-hydroxymyristoyl] glucosamine N-acyltransferase